MAIIEVVSQHVKPCSGTDDVGSLLAGAVVVGISVPIGGFVEFEWIDNHPDAGHHKGIDTIILGDGDCLGAIDLGHGVAAAAKEIALGWAQRDGGPHSVVVIASIERGLAVVDIEMFGAGNDDTLTRYNHVQAECIVHVTAACAHVDRIIFNRAA